MPRKMVDDGGLMIFDVATLYLTHESTRALLTNRRAGRKTKRKGKEEPLVAQNVEATGQEYNAEVVGEGDESTAEADASEEAANDDEANKADGDSNAERLSAAALARANVMLRRVRRFQELKDPGPAQRDPWHDDDLKRFTKALCMEAVRHKREHQGFDITRGTILEDAIDIKERAQMSAAIWQKTPQRATTIKSNFILCWQNATLDRADDLTSVGRAYLVPYDFAPPMQRNSHFSVLCIKHEAKVASQNSKPLYNVILPSRERLFCPVGALALYLDQPFGAADAHGQPQLSNIISKQTGQPCPFADAKSWRKACLLPKINNPLQPAAPNVATDSVGRVLEAANLTTFKKVHLMRKAKPRELDELSGCHTAHCNYNQYLYESLNQT